MNMYWPIILIVISNIFYAICSKSLPKGIDPLASLTVTYLIGAAASALLYLILSHGGNILNEYRQLNWTSFILGVAIVGLEAGSIYMYKAGWNISTGQLFHSVLLAVCLIIIGIIVYHEKISVTKIAGILSCLVGLFLITK